MRTYSSTNFFRAASAFKSKPSDATFFVISSDVSSNVISTPGSLYSVAPRTRNSTANIVLPQPGPPHTIVGRPFGTPPLVTSSKPAIPVRAFSSRSALAGAWPFRFLRIAHSLGAPSRSTDSAEIGQTLTANIMRTRPAETMPHSTEGAFYLQFSRPLYSKPCMDALRLIYRVNSQASPSPKFHFFSQLASYRRASNQRAQTSPVRGPALCLVIRIPICKENANHEAFRIFSNFHRLARPSGIRSRNRARTGRHLC